jgi:hypothetical protein
VLKGLPAVDCFARDIIYRPRNVRAHRVYGYSPVQQVLMTVNIALRRQLWQLDYFSEGSIPDALIGVPISWTPDQIKQFQDYWDTEFAGDLAKRRRAKFVPGEAAAKVVQTKEPSHKDDFDEWLARIICYAFSVPPQWAMKLMNRATADNQSAQAEDEGLEPTKEWVTDLIDEIIAEEFASSDLEHAWLDEDEADPKGMEAVLEGRLKLGVVTLNEMRDALGLDPYANAAADRPMVLTATGYMPIEANATSLSGLTRGSMLPLGQMHCQVKPVEPGEDASLQKYNPDQPRVPAGNSEGGQWTSEDGGAIGESSSRTRAGVQYASAAPPDISRVLTGNSRTDEVTKRLAQIYADTIERLERLPGQPQKYGIIVHAAFALAVIGAGIGEPMDVERSFDLPPGFSNSKESVRPDIVLRNDSGDVVAIYDIKTGEKGIDPWRARELRAATGTGPDVPIIVMYTDEAILKNQMI